MSNLTKSAMADRVLEHLSVKAATQTANAEDSLRVQELVDSAWHRLRKEGLAPYAVSAIPEWAQTPLRDYVAADAAPMFGRPPDLEARHRAKKEMATQVAGYRHPTPVRPHWF